MNLFKLINKSTKKSINTNTLNDVKEIEEIEFVPNDIPEIDIQSIYDDAHKKVMKDLVSKQIEKSIAVFVMGEECYEETRKAKFYMLQLENQESELEYELRMDNDSLIKKTLEKYPKAICGYNIYTRMKSIKTQVSVHDIIYKLTEDIIK